MTDDDAEAASDEPTLIDRTMADAAFEEKSRNLSFELRVTIHADRVTEAKDFGGEDADKTLVETIVQKYLEAEYNVWSSLSTEVIVERDGLGFGGMDQRRYRVLVIA